MFALISRLSRSRKAPTCEPSTPAARVVRVESLEDRRLNSVSPAGDAFAAASFSWGATQQGSLLAEPGESEARTVNKASPKLFLAARKAGGEQQDFAVSKASPHLFLAAQPGGEQSIIAVL